MTDNGSMLSSSDFLRSPICFFLVSCVYLCVVLLFTRLNEFSCGIMEESSLTKSDIFNSNISNNETNFKFEGLSSVTASIFILLSPFPRKSRKSVYICMLKRSQFGIKSIFNIFCISVSYFFIAVLNADEKISYIAYVLQYTEKQCFGLFTYFRKNIALLWWQSVSKELKSFFFSLLQRD